MHHKLYCAAEKAHIFLFVTERDNVGGKKRRIEYAPFKPAASEPVLRSDADDFGSFALQIQLGAFNPDIRRAVPAPDCDTGLRLDACLHLDM